MSKVIKFILSKKIIIPLLIIIFSIPLAIFSSLSIFAHPYFQYQTKEDIKLFNKETYLNEWAAEQPKLKRHDIRVLSKEDIPQILEHFNIKVTKVFSEPSYNYSNYSLINWRFKSPPTGLLGVYFKPRSNPLNETYPNSDDKYNLEDLLTYDFAIEEAFVFWDANVIPNEIDAEITLANTNVINEQDNVSNKVKIINDFLINNNIIKEPKFIELGCYNVAPTTGSICPLPLVNYQEHKIEAIYFDDGIRILNVDAKTQYTIEDLLKLSNGAKNIYLFTFKKIEIICSPDDQAINQINEFDPFNGNKIKTTNYRNVQKTIWYISEFDPSNGNLIKTTNYQFDGTTIESINEYNPSNKKNIKDTYFLSDGKTINYINEFDPYNGNKTKTTHFDPYNGNKTKTTFFKNDEKTIYAIREYNSSNEKRIKETCFPTYGQTIKIYEFDPSTDKRIKETELQPDGKTIDHINEFDLSTGQRIKITKFQSDGKTIEYINEFEPSTGKKIKEIKFTPDGKTIKCIIEFNPSNEQFIGIKYNQFDDSIKEN